MLLQDDFKIKIFLFDFKIGAKQAIINEIGAFFQNKLQQTDVRSQNEFAV